jgi:hypothetical protein
MEMISNCILLGNEKTSLFDSFTVNLNKTTTIGDFEVIFKDLKIGNLVYNDPLSKYFLDQRCNQ